MFRINFDVQREATFTAAEQERRGKLRKSFKPNRFETPPPPTTATRTRRGTQ